MMQSITRRAARRTLACSPQRVEHASKATRPLFHAAPAELLVHADAVPEVSESYARAQMIRDAKPPPAATSPRPRMVGSLGDPVMNSGIEEEEWKSAASRPVGNSVRHYSTSAAEPSSDASANGSDPSVELAVTSAAASGMTSLSDHGRLPGSAPHFDTDDAMSGLENTGLSRKQSKAVVRLLNGVVEGSFRRLERGFVSRNSHGAEASRQHAEMEQLRRDLLVLERSEIFFLKTKLEEARAQMDAMRQTRSSDAAQLAATQKLDLNLLQGRVEERLNNIERLNADRLNKLEHDIQTSIKDLHHRLDEKMSHFEIQYQTMNKEILHRLERHDHMFEEHKRRDAEVERSMEGATAKAKLDIFYVFLGFLLSIATLSFTVFRFWPGNGLPMPPTNPPPAAPTPAPAPAPAAAAPGQ
eukprot:Hpha_TRINITY_DN16599_c1_g1::TRINITY_DN16599_c1_g1_i1::g.135020::m.135020